MAAEAREKLPGHIMPTEKPQSAQPNNPTTGDGIRAIHKYEAMQSRQEICIKRSRLMRLPNLP